MLASVYATELNPIAPYSARLLAVSIFKYLRNNIALTQRKSYLLYFLKTCVYTIVNAEDGEAVFQSMDVIKKGTVYDLVEPFLGEGLLISTDQKWHFRRKILTPAFHFNILQSFLDVFKEETHQLLQVLGEKRENAFSLIDVIPQFTLNSVCEIALGVKLDDVDGSVEYRQAIHEIEAIAVNRSCRPLMRPGHHHKWPVFAEEYSNPCVLLLLVAILKKFIIKPVTRLEDIVYENGLVLRPHNDIQLKLARREKH